MTDVTSKSPERSNTTLWILIASFVIPAVLAYGYFFIGDAPGVKSNGTLIVPIIDIHTLNITGKDNAKLEEEELTPHWRMIYFTNADCDETCQSTLYNIRQVAIGMGKYQDRINYAVIHLEQPDSAFVSLLAKEHKGAASLYTKIENISAIRTLENNSDKLRSIYLVDPLGNIMMYFPEDLNPKLILKDLNKLLKISRLR